MECAYYLKAVYPSDKAAKNAADELDAFFAEARGAYEFLQSGSKDNPKEFWKIFKSKFPLVFDYARTLPGFAKKITGNPVEILNGKIDFGQDENNEVVVNGNILGWGDAAVWHMANWNPLCRYIETHYGATRVVWDTEENGCNSLDSLQPYDWEDIVTELLKHEELFPMLIGVHDDLDEILDLKAKGAPRGKKKKSKKS